MSGRRERGRAFGGEDLTIDTPGTRRRVAAIGWSLAFVVAVFLVSAPLAFAIGVAATGSTEASVQWLQRPGPSQLLAQSLSVLAAGFGFTWLIGRRANHLTWSELRYERGSCARRGFGAGLILGAAAAAFALLLAVAAGDATWNRELGDASAYTAAVARTLAILAPAALAEEVVFRGVPLVLVAAAFGRGPALLALAIAFGVGHLQNPHASWLGIVNIVVAGIFLGLAFYAPGGIWTAFGAHLGWNGALAALDAPVSGLPFRIPAIDYEPGLPVWLTGGAFGPEGGLAATAAFGAAAYAVARRSRKEPA